MAQFDLDRIFNNAENQSQKKKKKYDIDRILNSAEDISTRNTTMGTIPAITGSAIQATNKIIAPMAKITTNLTEADLRKIEQNSSLKTGTLNLNQMQAQQQKFNNLQQKGNEELKSGAKLINEKQKKFNNFKNDAKIIGSNLKDSALSGGFQLLKTVGMMEDNAYNTQVDMRRILLENTINEREKRGLSTDELKEELNNSSLYKKSDVKPFYQEKINKINQRMAENTEKASNPVTKKIAGLSQSLGNNVVGGAVTAINPTAGFAYFTGSAMGSYYDEAVNERGMSDREARNYATIMGLMEGETDKYLAAENIKGLRKIMEGTGLKKSLESFGLEIGENFVQEAVMPAISELATKGIAGNEHLKYDFRTANGWKELARDSLSDGIDGALSAILLGGTTRGVASCVNLTNKARNGGKISKQEIKTAISDAQKSGVNVETILKDKIQENAKKRVLNLENETSGLPQNVQNNIEQQTIQTDTKTAQNQNISQINNANNNNLKNTAINEINNSKISEQAKKDMLNAINGMENVDEESYNNIKQTLNEINKNELQTNSTYQDNLERRKNYVKYKDDINTYDNSAVEEVLSIIPTNRNGKRTVNQWLQVADEIGKRISGKSNAEIQEIAYKSWFENQPTKNITQYDSARKTSIGFQKLNSDMWVNKINEAVLKERTRLENTTNSQQVNFNNTQTNQESLLKDILNNKVDNNLETLYNNTKIGETTIIPVETILSIQNSEGGYRTETQINNLKKDIEKNGITTPIEIYRKNNGTFAIENGNHRLKIAQELGIKDIPVKMVESWENIGVSTKNATKDFTQEYGGVYDDRITEKNSNIDEGRWNRERSRSGNNNQFGDSGRTRRDAELYETKSYSNEQTSINESKRNNSKQLKNPEKGSFSIETRTNLEDIKINNNIAPIGKNVKRVEKTAPIGENVVMYNNYKKKIIKTQENAINNLIKYKNFSISNIDETIRKKENIINGKKNKDTKTVAIIKSQIENLKIRKNKIEDLYLSKIDKVNKNSTKEKVELETRNMMKKASRETITAEIAPLVSDLTKYEDKKSGILYNRETAQRNIEDIVKDKELAKTINEVIFNPIQVHQAQKTREINELYEKINKLDLDKTQKYLYVPKGENIAIKIDEATLAQLIIEKKINDTDLRKYNLSNEKIQKIYKTANTFKEILDYLHPRINDEQIKFGFSPIGKRENYFPHFFENKPDMFLGKVASYFGIDLSNNNSLPTEIAGKTDTFKPGRTWNSNIQKRRTNKTDYNALKAMEKYIQGAMELIYTTEDIQKVREFSRQIRYKFSDKGMQNEINNIYKNKELTQEAKDSAIDGIFKNTESGLPNFVTWLDDYANTLAGKKSFADRNIEHNIGRNVYTSMAGIESKIAANTIGGNLSVSLTNFAPIFQAAGTTKWNYLLTGILQTAKNDIQGLRGNKDLSFVSNSNFLTNRFGIDTIAKKKITQKMSDIASIPMNVIDNFTAESVVRAKYLENIDKGMSEEIALDSADKYAARIMADRSKGALPLVFNSKNPLSKLITMFQVEPNNMVSNYLKDMPREAKNKGQLIWHYSKLMAASWGVNTIMIALRGGNEVLPDPVRWVSYLIQAILGDDDDKEKAKEDLAESVIGSIPFLSNLAGFVGMEDIGRVPISNAMPNITNIAKLADSEADEKYKKEIAIKEFTKPLLYLGLPVGGAQIKKSIEGISTINAGGSYKTNKSGESQLQFPVENKTVKKYIKAGLFGKYSISDAKEFSERGYKALSSKQTEGYKKVQIPYKEFLEYIDNTSGKKKNEKIQYIEKMNINENKKWNMYTYDVFSATERNDGGSQLKDAEYITKNGTSKAEYIRIYNKANENELSMPTKEEYDNLRKNGLELETFIDYKIKIKELSNKLSLKEEKMKSNDKINILLKSNYSAKEKSAIYKTKILTNDSAKEKFELLEKTGITDEKYINEYLKYLQQDFESDIKENGTTKGKTVSGSSKKKTYEYVNNMKITYEQKLMLLGTQYKLNDTERTKLYKYVKSLDYTEDEMKSVFESLKGFTVYKNGKVTW